METKYETHGLDTQTQVFFYEQDFYMFSNFSAFTLKWKGLKFDTSEAAYHWEKFNTGNTPIAVSIRDRIINAASAHEAFKIAEVEKSYRRTDWDNVKEDIMYQIIWEKVNQHEYVRRKLLATGDREIVENSWRDDWWGWGLNRNGKNALGKIWMKIRQELRSTMETKPV